MNIRADCMLDILIFLDGVMAGSKEGGSSENSGDRFRKPVNSGVVLGNEDLKSRYEQDLLMSLFLLITMQFITVTKPSDAGPAPVWDIHGITPRGRSYITTKVFS